MSLAVALVSAFVYTILVLCFGIASDHHGIGDLGSWLSGTLTPGLLLASIVTFWISDSGRREQLRSQQKIAQITERAAFVNQREVFERSLSYYGSCVLTNERLGGDRHDQLLKTGRGGYERLWLVLARTESGDASDDMKYDLQTIKKSELFLKEFQEALISVLSLADQAQVSFLLDRRIRELPILFTRAQLWKADDQPIVGLTLLTSLAATG